MAHYWLDGEPRSIDSSLDSLGKLLEIVDRDLEGRGRAVSVVRLGGVDLPSFRDETLARRELATLGKIEILTSDAAELLAETIVTARRSIPVLSSSAARLADDLRGLHALGASRRLMELIDALRTLTVLTAVIAEVVDLERAGRPPLMASDITDAVADSLRRLIEGQASQDWARVADCLEGELAPAIVRWQALFDRLDDRRLAA